MAWVDKGLIMTSYENYELKYAKILTLVKNYFRFLTTYTESYQIQVMITPLNHFRPVSRQMKQTAAKIEWAAETISKP